jgi:hypothetical protein
LLQYDQLQDGLYVSVLNILANGLLCKDQFPQNIIMQTCIINIKI